MNSHNISTLKRRRPFGHEGSPVQRVFHDPGFHDLAGVEGPPLSTNDRGYFLEQAAKILGVPVSRLVELRQPPKQSSVVEQAAVTLGVPVDSLLELSEQHRTKRPRVNTSISMPNHFTPKPVEQDASEKFAPAESHYGRGSNHLDAYRNLPAVTEPSGSLLGIHGSRIAECISSFTGCTPCADLESQDEDYQALATAAPYEYGNSRLVAAVATPTSAVLPLSQGPEFQVFTTSAAEASNLLGYDDHAYVGGYLPHYPTSPSFSPNGIEQHHTVRETMIYPGELAMPPYPGPIPDGSHAVPVSIQPTLHIVEHAGIYTPSQAPAETIFPPNSNPVALADASPPYGLYAGYGSSSAMIDDSTGVGVDIYGRPPDIDMMFPSQRAPPAKRGPFKDHAERQKTAYTRKIGSCIRCRMQRIRCHTDPDDDKGPCGTCKKVANTSKIWRLPCLRLKINDVVLSKTGPVKGHEWTLRWKDGMVTEDISSWASSEIKTIRVTEGYTGRSVELHVRQFVPQAGDSLERSWVAGGVRRSVKIPPFALVDMDAVKASYDGYIKTGIKDFCQKLVGAEKKLLWKTYGLAIGMAGSSSMDRKERQLLTNTLELWVSIRLTTTSFEIVGDETLGMTHNIMDETSPLSGKIPLPPVMGAQLDSILIHQIQSKFRHDTLELLQRLTQENKPKTWLTTYLATFILLHNIALVIKHDASYARKHGIQRRFAREDKVKEYYLGAITLLAYFHYRGGSKIFAADFKDDDPRLHSNEESVQFIAYMRRYAKDNEAQWRDLVQSGEVENEYYFISQMFEENWLPRSWPG